MRSVFSVLGGMLVLSLASALALPASAALVWGETTKDGYPLTHWARGASVSEATNMLRAYAGKNAQVLMTCRQPGWYAYVGSSQDFRRGVSCGYESRVAALFKARAECEYEGGTCDVERVGYDTGEPFSAVPPTSLPVEIPGPPDDRAPVRTHQGPLLLQ